MVEARNFMFMFYGFLAAWLILVLYVVSLASRERAMRKELTRLKNMIEERDREREKARAR
jgi:CcmD family protein